MKLLTGTLLATSMICSSAVAQSADQIVLTDAQKRLIYSVLTAPKASPGASVTTPSGFGAGQGQVFASIGGTTNDGDLDGSASVGIGFGDASELVALELNANIISLTNNGAGSGIGEQGSISAKLSRQLTPTSSLSFGAENLVGWGDGSGNVDPSLYLAYTHVQALSDDPLRPMLLTLTAGIGNERFSDLDNNVRSSSPGFFASAGLAVTRRVGLALDYNGNFASAGVSFVPMVDQPLTVSLSATNINSVSAADGGTASGDTEFGASIGYSWSF